MKTMFQRLFSSLFTMLQSSDLKPQTSGLKLLTSTLLLLTSLLVNNAWGQVADDISYSGSSNQLSTSWTVPAGVTSITIECWGGGGGGGAKASSKAGAGGGGGGYVRKTITGVSAGETVSLLIGKGGSSASTGYATVATYNGSTTITCTAGGGGAGASGATTAGSGGTGSSTSCTGNCTDYWQGGSGGTGGGTSAGGGGGGAGGGAAYNANCAIGGDPKNGSGTGAGGCGGKAWSGLPASLDGGTGGSSNGGAGGVRGGGGAGASASGSSGGTGGNGAVRISYTVAACTNPTTAGSIGSDQTICYNGDPANLTSSVLPTGHSGTLEYKWQKSTTSNSTDFIDIASSNSTSYDPPTGLTQTTWYRRLARVSCAADWSGAIATTAVQVTVRSQFTTGAINTTGETICYNGNPGVIGSSTASSGGDGSITYSWRSSADSYAAAIAGATSATYDPGLLTTTTSYRRYARDGTCNTSPSVSTGTWTVTVRSQFTTGAINTTGETICYNGDPGVIGSSTASSGGDESITYSWRSSVDSYTAAIVGATSATYDPGLLTTTTSYRRYARDGTCNTSPSVSTGTWTVTVSSESVGGSVSGGTSVCSGTNSTNLTLSGHTGSVTKWQYSTVSDFSSDLNDVANTSTSLTATNLSASRYYRAVVTSGACAAANSSSATITVSSAPTTQASNLVASNLGTTTLTLSWTRGNGSGVAVFVKANPNVASDPTNGTSYSANTAFGSGSQIGTSGWYCVYSGTGTTVNITGLSGGTTYNFAAYEYSSSTCYHLTEATASASTYCTLNNNNQTTYKITSFSTSGGCSSMSNTSTRNVPSGCLIDYTASYSTSHDRSSTVSFSMTSSHSSYYAIWIDWNIDGDFADAGENVYLNTNGNSSVSSSFSVPAGATLGTTRMRVGIDFMYSLSSSMQCGSNDSFSQYEDYSFVVNAVGTTPAAPSVGIITQPTCTTSTGSVALSGLPASGSWTVTGSPSGGLSSSGITGTVTGLTAGQTYTFTVTNSSNCTSTSSGNAVINTQPSTPSAPTSVTPSATTICHGNSVNLNATSAGNTINWYTVATDGTAIQTGVSSASDHSVSPTSNTTYYAEAQNGSDCKSSRVATGLVTVENPVSAVNTAIGTTLQNNDYVWVGQTDAVWSTANNWRQFNGTNLVAAGSAPGSNNTNRIYVVQNSTSSNCIFNATSLSLGGALGVTSLFVGTGTSLNLNNQNLNLSGNITINGTFTPGSGTITLSGSTNQTLDGSSALSFSNVTINKSNGTLTAANDMTITGTLTLTNGILDMNSKTLTMGTASANGTITGGSASSYIVALDGGTPSKLIHRVNSTSNATYSFPIGTGSKYTPVTLVMKGGTLSNATIQVWTKNSKVTGMSDAMSCYLNRSWFVEPTGITSPTYDIQLGFASGDFTGDPGFDLNPVKLSSSIWYKPSGSLIPNGTTQGTTIATSYVNSLTPTTSSGTVYWNGLTSFSEFGGAGGSDPLPVELVSFSGACEDGKVNLSWQTASEFNSSHFDIEKSRDGENWQVIETIPAAGNSNELLNYEAFDQVTNILNYYRLNQVDIDGTNKRYDPIAVSCDEAQSGVFMTYPNPSANGFNVLVNDEDLSGETTLNIYSASGSITMTKIVEVKEGINLFMIHDKLLPGLYFIELKDQNNKTKMIKHLVN